MWVGYGTRSGWMAFGDGIEIVERKKERSDPFWLKCKRQLRE